jgi:divinyl protochlorophyllide a 8-vinyl-reductase
VLRQPDARLLTAAIARHAWTFAGSGEFSAARDAGGLILSITHNPAAREVETELPSCHYFAATFERIYTEILGPGVWVVETGCEAAGDSACTFRLSWPGVSRRASPRPA